MADFTAQIDTKALKAIEKAMDDATRFRPLLDRIGRVMLADTRMNFRQGKGPGGTPWEPLRIRRGQPLRDTGRLQNSITYAVSDTEVEIGTNVAYAAVHQSGATITPKNGPHLVFPGPRGMIFAKKVTIPARPFIGLEQRQAGKINDAINAWIKEVVDGTSH